MADEIQGEIKRLYGGLEQYGRKGILRRIREQAARRHVAHHGADLGTLTERGRGRGAKLASRSAR